MGWLLGALILVGVPFGWWVLGPRDRTSSAGIESVRGTATSTILVVTYMAGAEGCADPGGVQVEEDSDEVRLTASTINRDVRPFATTDCPAIGRLATSSVRLSAPLGDRQVTGITRGEHGAVPVQAP
jgi:hypothetical protein